MVTRIHRHRLSHLLSAAGSLSTLFLLASPACGQSLPVHITDGSASTLWWITQTGLGKAGEFEISNPNSPDTALIGTTQGHGYGVAGYSANGLAGVFGTSGRNGVYGLSESAKCSGVYGRNDGSGYGVEGITVAGFAGVFGTSPENGVYGLTNSDSGSGVNGRNNGSGPGVTGRSKSGFGVYGKNGSGSGRNPTFRNGGGVWGDAQSGAGVTGTSSGDAGVIGLGGTGVYGEGDVVAGVRGFGMGRAAGVFGVSEESWGVYGAGRGKNQGGHFISDEGIGLLGATGSNGTFAGFFVGDVYVSGTLSASAKNFKIDHPLDPANKYLVHSCVESDQMMNIYNGNVTTDANGDATVVLPNWFQALNKDFRYQLTVIGQFAQAIIAREIENSRFTIKTDKPRVKVSWQVTGVRQDAFSRAHPMQVEQDKPEEERGTYLHPAELGMTEEQGTHYATVHPVSSPGPKGK